VCLGGQGTLLEPARPYQVIASSAQRAPVVAHVPHASAVIPDAIRANIALDDRELQQELVRMTDWHVDRLFD
jgi:N-formylglutamate deformylase